MSAGPDAPMPRRLAPRELPERALVLAAHAGDALRGAGGAIAAQLERGDALRLLVLAGPAPDEAAASALGLRDVAVLGLERGGVGAEFELAARLLRAIAEHEPQLVYAPAPTERHPDRRAAITALAAALARRPRVRVLLYGVERAVPATALLDVSGVAERKQAALGAAAGSARRVRLEAARALERVYALPLDDDTPEAVEGFVELDAGALPEYVRRTLAAEDAATTRDPARPGERQRGRPAATAVISTWNKRDDVRANLEALRAQTLPFADVVVVDNASTDGTAAMIAEEFPDVRLIVMPHSRYGACETFNIGFASSRTELTAILDDDVVLPPHWLERATERLSREPSTTAIVSTKIVEPGMPEAYRDAPEINRERYMSTFRGCASLARTRALAEAEYYDERLFIYGNERDLTCRLLNLGYRVLQYPGVEAFHKTPFGIKMGKRSLYYHARNAWLAQLKYAPLRDLLRLPFLVLGKVLLRSREAESSGRVAGATGTIGISRSIRETKGAWRVLLRAGLSVLWNVPYCLRRRRPVSAPDFELPIE